MQKSVTFSGFFVKLLESGTEGHCIFCAAWEKITQTLLTIRQKSAIM